MKIHIVQKGDTLWKLAQKYGVNFEQLKAANTQLSNPDMIMPGMKIKIPTGSVPVKKENQVAPQAAPMKEQPVQQKEVQKPPMQMPVMPQQMAPPTKKQKTHVDFNTFETNINFYQPQVKPKKEMPTVQKPPVSKPKKEAVKPKEEVKPVQQEMKPKHYAPKPAVQPQMQPQMQPKMQPKMQPQMYQPQQPMPCPPKYLQPISPLMPGCQNGCGPAFPQPMPYGDQMQPMQQQPFQGTQSPMPYYPQHSMQPQQFQPTQSPMPYYPQQQPTTQIPHQQMPMQQPYPDMKNDYCGPGQPIMYGPNGQMMPIQQYQQQQPPFMNGYNESDDYDD